ncbi:hypothetical protein CNMCM5793_002766 [Aspergillus hiratsukae]|uniref:Mtf2-like C-terminal domain-containing protein n=1 Tax=Aspergillus hiratsukae TaxID=1194566 RepID=A0A8H6PE79_9EURO|nr:hypothetical protein CNMCM5793_002766 [Aspergillus hiratsukae]KAF7167181.1 hypothetical protein CNMCM6106_002835 [Aspergillus hiratsukae]
MPLRMSRTCLALATVNSPVPFLYQTRTLTAPLRYAKWNARQDRSLQSTSTTFAPELSLGRGEESVHDSESPENVTPPLKSDSACRTPSKNGRRARTSYLKEKRAATVSQSHPLALQQGPETRTMTSTEKKAFGNLLEQIGVKEKESKDDPEAATGEPEKVALSEDERSQIDNIFNSVLKDIRRKEQGSEDSTEGSAKRMRKERLTIADPRAWAIRSTVQREKAKIESALRAAIDEGKGDTGILEVCEERIFSLLRYLGDGRLPDDSGAPTTSTEDSGTPTMRTEDSGTPTTSSADKPTPHSTLEVPESVPVEEVVALLYPKMLLVAFRLLNSHFPGSPLISQFRSMVKSHGRTSAVLGSSTRLYNELLYFYWRGCSDLPSVVSLLKEMETTGLEPDERTCGLLKSISEQRVRDLNREDRNSWWDMAPNMTAVRELFGENGWLPRLEKRVKELRTLPSSSSTKLLADRFEM